MGLLVVPLSYSIGQYVFLCQCHAVLITITLKQNLTFLNHQKEMQIKTTANYYLTPVRLAILKNMNDKQHWLEYEKQRNLICQP